MNKTAPIKSFQVDLMAYESIKMWFLKVTGGQTMSEERKGGRKEQKIKKANLIYVSREELWFYMELTGITLKL